MSIPARLVLLVALSGHFQATSARPPEKTSTNRDPIRRQSVSQADPGALSGRLAVTVYDNFDAGTSFTQYTLQTVDGGDIEIAADVPYQAGDEILVAGAFENGTITPTRLSLLSAVPQRENAAMGNQSVAVILVNSIDNPLEEITPREVWRETFDSTYPESLNSWIQEVSYGKTYLSGSVFGWYTLNITEQQLCNSALEAVQAADADVDFAQFNRIIMVWHRTPNVVCSFGGVSSVGLSTRLETQDGAFHVSLARLNGIQTISDGIAHHEFGHSLGLRHASDMECGPWAVGKTCQHVEYGDQFDVMGDYSAKGHFSAVNKEKLGWLTAEDIITAHSGRFEMAAIEAPSKDIKAVKIPISEKLYYYVEFRKPIGHDMANHSLGLSHHGHDVYAGAMIRTNENASLGDSQLIDLTPASGPYPQPNFEQYHDSLDVTLKTRTTFRDDRYGIEITALTYPDSLAVRISRD